MAPRHAALLAGAAASTAAIEASVTWSSSTSSGGATLAGLAPEAMPPGGPLPQWSSSAGAAVPGQEGQVIDFSDPQVNIWRENNKVEVVPRPQASGWRVLSYGGVRGEWCVQRIAFKSGPDSEVPLAGCRIEAPKKELLTQAYATRHAFEDTSSEGCALEDSAGLRYIGLVCDHDFEVDRIEVIQQSGGAIAESAQVQQLQLGSWIDIGVRTHLAVDVVQQVFVAATCAEDVCGSTSSVWTPKTGARLPETCARRVCNKGECCQHKGSCSAETCVTPYWGLKANASGTRCAGPTCQEDFCCEQKGTCLASLCEAAKEVPKLEAPKLCAGEVCEADECCEAATCTAEVCHGGVLKDKDGNHSRPTRCAETVCTAVECCVPTNFDNGLDQPPAPCEESVCADAGAGVSFKDSAFGKTCASAVCSVDECCTPPPPPQQVAADEFEPMKGACQASAGGKSKVHQTATVEECRAGCSHSECLAYEWNEVTANCELHTKVITKTEPNDAVTCYIRKVAMDQKSTNIQMVALPAGPQVVTGGHTAVWGFTGLTALAASVLAVAGRRGARSATGDQEAASLLP